jgi:hypothetical protein
MQMPLIGSANVLLTRQTVTGSPFLEENGKSVTLKFTLPIASGGAIGMYLLRKTMGNLLNKNMKAGVDTKDFAEIAKVFCTDIGVVGSSFLQQTIANSITGLSVSGTSDFKITWCISDPINDLKSLAPLPGMKLVNAQKRLPWRLDFITITNNLNAGLNSPGSLMGLELPASLKVAISRGDVLKITGPNTLHDLTSKYNALSLGTLDGKSKKSTAIDSLLSGQSTQILKICRNIGRGDTNAAFELQVMYNDILKKMPNEKKKSFQKMMADFIANCQKLNKISAEKVKKSSLSKKELSEINENAAVRSDAFAGAKSTASAAGQKDTDESEKTLATENVSQEMAENTGLLDIIDAIGDKPIKAEPLDRDDVRKAIDHIEQLLAAYFLYVFLPHYNQKHSASTGVLADEQSVNF